MTTSFEARRATFKAMHAEGCFVLPNPWDIGSARMLQHMGFAALASTGAGFAWAAGRPDYSTSQADVLEHLRELCASIELPVNADFESGYARDPVGVAANVALAVETGVAGLSIEDRDAESGELYDTPLSVARIRAARAAIASSGAEVVLVGRTEGLLSDPSAINQAADKLAALADAGADCLYAPGVRKPDDIALLVRAIAPKPLNVLMMGPGLGLTEMADLGVRRVSLGGSLARVAWAAMISAAEQMKSGSFDSLEGAAPGRELNRIFATAIR